MSEIRTYDELRETLGKEQLENIMGKYTNHLIPYYKRSYDDEVSPDTVARIYENFKEEDAKHPDEMSFLSFYEYELTGMFFFEYLDIENDEVGYIVEEEIFSKIKNALPSDAVLSPDLKEEIIDKLRTDYEVSLDWSSIAKETFPSNLKVNLMLATPEEADRDLSSIGDMKCLAFGETSEGYRVATFAEEDREVSISACNNMLTNIVYAQGHTLEEVFNGRFSNNNFINSVRQELTNKPYNRGNVVVLATVDLETLSLIASGKNITIGKDATIGLFEEYLGTGSLLEIDLEKNLTVSGNNIFKVQFEGVRKGNFGPYTVDQVYGLIGSCWSDCVSRPESGEEGFEISKTELENDVVALMNGTAPFQTLDNVSYTALNDANNVSQETRHKRI